MINNTEILQIAGELQNQKILDLLHMHFMAGMVYKGFIRHCWEILMVESGKQVGTSVIAED